MLTLISFQSVLKMSISTKLELALSVIPHVSMVVRKQDPALFVIHPVVHVLVITSMSVPRVSAQQM